MKSPKIDLHKKNSSSKKSIEIIVWSVLLCGGVAVLSFWFREFLSKQDSYVQKIILKNKQIYILQTSIYHSEDGNYTKSKLFLLDEKFNQVKHLDLDLSITKILVLNNHLIFLEVDGWGRTEKVARVYCKDFTSQVLDKKSFTKTLFPAGAEQIAYSDVTQLLKITDKKGYVSCLNLDNLQDYGNIKDEYAFRNKNPNPYLEEQISESHVMYDHYEQFRLDFSERRRKLYKTQNTKIEAGFKNEEQLKQEKAEQEAHASTLDFLDGKFVGASLAHQKLVLISFESTEHQKFFLYCLDTNLKLLWVKTSVELNIPVKNLKYTSCTINDKYLYLSFGNELFILEISTGKLVQKIKF